MPRKTAIGQDLLVLTLALEDALQSENWAEAGQLFAARSEILERAEADRSTISESALDRIKLAEARIFALLRDRRTAITRGMIDQVHERQASRTYRPARPRLGFEGTV